MVEILFVKKRLFSKYKTEFVVVNNFSVFMD